MVDIYEKCAQIWDPHGGEGIENLINEETKTMVSEKVVFFICD